MKISTELTLTSEKVHSVRYDDKRGSESPPIRSLYIAKSAFGNGTRYPEKIKVEVHSDG